jgi:hypothetical protein
MADIKPPSILDIISRSAPNFTPPTINSVNLAAALSAGKEDLRRRDLTSAKQKATNTFYLKLFIVGFTIMVCAIFLITWLFSQKQSKRIILVPGGNFGNVSNIPFIDNGALLLMYYLLNNLTVSCTPPLNATVMQTAYTGQSREATNIAWEGIRQYVKGDPRNLSTGCYFYGLLSAEARAGDGLGPVDMCQGYVHAGIDIFHAYFNLQMPANITQYLTQAYNLMYPLNMFWKNSVDPQNMQNQVVAQMYLIAQCLAGQGALCSPIINVEQLAVNFCNQYFANGPADTGYYGEEYMPWLGFPFPGVMQRSGDNYFVPEAVKLLTTQNIIDIANDTVLVEFPIYDVYIAGDVLVTSPAMELLIESLLYNVTLHTQPAGTTLYNYLLSLNSIVDTYVSNQQTFLILGRYAEDSNTYNGASILRNVYPTPAFFLFSNVLLANDSFPVTDINLGKINLEISNFATSRSVMNVVDFNTTLPNYDNLYSQQYLYEKYVANYIDFSAGNVLYITMTETMQLLNSFSLKNTVINGIDFGGLVTTYENNIVLQQNNLNYGFVSMPFTIYMDIDVMNDTVVDVFGDAVSYPASYDIRSANPNCLAPVKNQGSCSNCYAQSTISAMSTRFCMRGLTSTPAPISTGHATSCYGDKTINGCAPSSPGYIYSFLIETGVVDETCFPTKTITCPNNQFPCQEQPCQVNCGSKYSVFKDEYISGTPYYIVNGEAAFRSELYFNGPFASCFYVPTDFFDFFKANPNGCYSNEVASVSGGHCVLAIGYSENNLYFRNSWGQSWGNKGDFCVKSNMARAQKIPWFTNSGWAGKAGSITQYGSNTVVPANTGRNPALLTSQNAPIANVPQPPPTPTARPRPPSASVSVHPSVISIIIPLLIMIIKQVLEV